MLRTVAVDGLNLSHNVHDRNNEHVLMQQPARSRQFGVARWHWWTQSGILMVMQPGKNATDDNLLKAQRHERILTLLAERGQVHASALSELFGVSNYTIRRDLDEMSEAGKLER